MFGFKLVRTQEYERLLAEVDFWRTAFQGERTRSDRLTDSIVQSAGHPPVSDEGLSTMRSFRENFEQETEALAQLQEDDMELLPSIVDDMLSPTEKAN
jgi:hypothetical protein